MTTEQMLYSDEMELLTNGTWTYKPPCSKSIPQDFRVGIYKYEYTKDAKIPMSHEGVASSKNVGEPPLVGVCAQNDF